MTCEQIREELTSRLVFKAGSPWPEPVAAHLEACAGCRAELDSLQETWTLIAQWPEVPPGQAIRARLIQRVRQQLLRDSILTVSGWTPAVLAAVIGVGLSLGLSLLVPYSVLISLCRETLQVSDPHAAPYLVAGMVYGIPLALGVWILRKRVPGGALIGSLEASLLFLVILAPYIIAQCREFAPALQAAFVSGLAGGAVISSLAGLGLSRRTPLSREGAV